MKELDGEKAQLDGLRFVDAAHGFVWGSRPSKEDEEEFENFALYTEDCGESWESVDFPRENVSRRLAVHSDGSLFYVYKDQLVHLMRTTQRRWSKYKSDIPPSCSAGLDPASPYRFGENCWPYIEGEIVWLIAKSAIYQCDTSGHTFEAIGSFPAWFEIDAVSSDGAVITVVGGKQYPRGDYQFHMPEMIVFRSENGGRNWRPEKPGTSRGTPFAFVGSRIWTLAEANRICCLP
jgi:hypothetical protein